MSKNCNLEPEYPTLSEMKYFNIALKKIDCAVFLGDIPLVFITNPKKVQMGSLQFASGMGMVFFRLGAEKEAKKITNLYAELDNHYLTFTGEFVGHVNENKPPQMNQHAEAIRTEKDYAIPSGIEPHDGIEYALMHKGLKKIALFEYSLPIEFLTNPLKIELDYMDYKHGQGRIYFKPESKFFANELRKELNRNKNPFNEDHIHRVGRFLGYKTSDIEDFIDYCQSLVNFYD